ncbi:MAG: PIN domain nuclease, partial [Sphingomonas sp.]|nr:PIN domain nuclease [Sphingomonas sp.]
MTLVDSSVWIDFFRGSLSPQVKFLEKLIEERAALVGDLVMVEVLQGFAHDHQFRFAVRRFSYLPTVTIADPDLAVAAARNYRTLRAKGVTIRKTIDTLIATRCIIDGIPLLYSDRDFDA